MLHTFLDRDGDAAKEAAREPLKDYLGTSVDLLKNVASAFPTFAGRGKGTDDAVQVADGRRARRSCSRWPPERYFEHERPVRHARRRRGDGRAGVRRSASTRSPASSTSASTPTPVIDSLDLLLEAKATRRRPRAASAIVADADRGRRGRARSPSRTTPSPRWRRHGVTHLQCTPSLAAMLVADPADRAGARRRSGSCWSAARRCPPRSSASCGALLPGRLTNMYGPTETTIWSLTHEIDAAPDGSVPIGRPIANTTVYVLDAARRAAARSARRRAAHRRRRRRPRLPRPARADRRALRRSPGHGPGVPHRRPRPHPSRRATSSSSGAPTTRSRSAATASSSARSRPCSTATPTSCSRRRRPRRHAATPQLVAYVVTHGNRARRQRDPPQARRRDAARDHGAARRRALDAFPLTPERQGRPQGPARAAAGSIVTASRRAGRRRRPTTPSAGRRRSGPTCSAAGRAATTTSSRSAGTRCSPSRCTGV